MYRVYEFKKALETVDVTFQVVIWGLGLLGVGYTIWEVVEYGWRNTLSLQIFIGAIYLYGLHLARVLGLGTGFTLVQIAENTGSDEEVL